MNNFDKNVQQYLKVYNEGIVGDTLKQGFKNAGTTLKHAAKNIGKKAVGAGLQLALTGLTGIPYGTVPAVANWFKKQAGEYSQAQLDEISEKIQSLINNQSIFADLKRNFNNPGKPLLTYTKQNGAALNTIDYGPMFQKPVLTQDPGITWYMFVSWIVDNLRALKINALSPSQIPPPVGSPPNTPATSGITADAFVNMVRPHIQKLSNISKNKINT
jgi:hypothetical protein